MSHWWLFLSVRCFGILGFCAVGSNVKRGQALAAGLLQNRSLWRLSLSEFGSSLWGPPGRKVPMGGLLRRGEEVGVEPSGCNLLGLTCTHNIVDHDVI